jgi:protein SCO1/2
LGKKIKIKFFVIILIVLLKSLSVAQEEHVEIGIDEKLGNYLPFEDLYTNSLGEKVALGDVINKPILLAFVYYECPGICNSTLTELAWVIDRVELDPGKDFEVVCISIDHNENFKVAANSKKNYLASLQRKFPTDAWKFLVADSTIINNVTKSAGFYFKKYGDEYRHPGGLITIAPDGKISRYIFGSQFNQFDVKMALLDAEAGKTNPTVAKMLQFCFSYDAEGRKYSLNITRIVGAVMLLGVFSLLIILIRKNKKKNK